MIAVDESKLRKVSLTTNDFLFAPNQSNASVTFDTNQKVFEMLMQMKDKYRLFLITQVSGDSSPDHDLAQAQLKPLIDSKVVKSHRVMYCTTAEGKKSLVRQLNAELHIDADV